MSEATLELPAQSLHLRSECQPEFILETDDKGKQRRKVKALFASGKKIARHWGWNNLYIDLDSVKVTKKQLPLLLNHDQRIGVVTAKRESEGFVAEGYLLQNDQAAQVAQDAADGFPWQCSCWLQPARVEEVMEGASVNVNGTTVDGPAWVWRDCWLREVTLTELGADENTKAEILSQGKSLRVPVERRQGETAMADPKDGQKMTVELLSEQHPDLVKTVRDQAFAAGRAEGLTAGRDEGTKLERERAARIVKRATGSQLEQVIKFVAEGTDADGATDELLADPRRKALENRAALEAAAPLPTPAPAAGKPKEGETETLEDCAKREFTANKELQRQFGNLETYVWHKKAVAAGAVKES